MSTNYMGELHGTPLKLMVVIASTRPDRIGLPIGQWFGDHATDHGAFEVEMVDLAELALPFMDEPHHPRLQRYTHQHTRDWSAQVDSADAFVFVTPEYNHGYNAPLKNAIDYLAVEWYYKPVGFVSYGGVSGGIRAAETLKLVVPTLKMVPLNEAVVIPFVNTLFDDEQQLQPTEIMNTSATVMLTELGRWATALRPLRASTTIPA